jgi:hypothetical protein
VIEADTQFLDAQGKSVPLGQGKTIEEKLTGIRLIPLSDVPNSAEQPGSDQTTTKPADKVPANVQPSTQPPKDGSR